MTTAPADNMVLRTIYMPLDVDRRLREIAFSQNISKGELMRKFILEGIQGVDRSGQATLAEKVERLADAKAIREAQVAAAAKSKAPRAAAGKAKVTARAKPVTAKAVKASAPARVLEPAE
jgi:hypothetical protein